MKNLKNAAHVVGGILFISPCFFVFAGIMYRVRGLPGKKVWSGLIKNSIRKTVTQIQFYNWVKGF